MRYLSEEYLENIGFHLHWSQEHNYRTQYSRYDESVSRGIHLISQTSIIAENENQNAVYDIWFYGQDLDGRYTEIDSHLSISYEEELEMLLNLLRE